MNSVILLRRRRVLWGTVMTACLLSGVFLTTRSADLLWRSAAVPRVAQGSHFNPAASPNPESRIPNPGDGAAAQPRLAEAYGKLPLSFEVNKGQTDSRVKFLSRGSGYSLFLTGNEAVLSLRKPVQIAKGKRQMANGVAQGSHSNPAVLPGLFAGLEAHENGAAFPAFFRTPTAKFTDSAPANDCGGKDPEKPQGLKGEPCATQATDALLRMKLVGANPNPRIVGTDELPGKSNYFIGNDPKKWRTNVPNYAKVKYANVYSGVDLVYYGNQGQLEYDFVVSPGADPAAITLELETGQSKIQNRKSKIDKNGDLVVGTDGGELIFHKPVVYQPALASAAGLSLVTRHSSLVEGRYRLDVDNCIHFELGRYDRRRPVVIDPVLAYSTYLGGSGDDAGSSIAVDVSGNAYVTGGTDSSDFPTTPSAFQRTSPGGVCFGGSPCGHAFVSKLNASGTALLYSTYLGGSSGDSGSGIAVDASGNAYVTGSTTSSNFPTTSGVFQTTFGGGSYLGDAFLSKLSATGSRLVYSTYLGGSGEDGSFGVALDASGNAYLGGVTDSSNFPTTSGAFQRTLTGLQNAFVSKMNATGSTLVYSTYLGGGNDGGSAIALDSSGNAYVTGNTQSPNFPTTPGAFQTTLAGSVDAFVSKLNPAGSTLVYSTFLGGTKGNGTDNGITSGNATALDASDNAYVTGGSDSSDFPTTPGAWQTTYEGEFGEAEAFVSKLNAAGSALVYSTFLGGAASGGESIGHGIELNAAGNAHVTGFTFSFDFPTTGGAFQTPCGGPGPPGNYAFFTKLNAAGSALLYSTVLGGSTAFEVGCDNGTTSGSAIALDRSGNAYVTGGTSPFPVAVTSTFLVTPGAFQTGFGGGESSGDAFVAKISPADAPGIALVPGSLTFGPQPVGPTSAPLTVTLLDAGSQPLRITSVVASGDFAQTNTCGSSVSAGTSCTISVTFTPTAAGMLTGAVTITDNAPGSPHRLLLTGVGVVEPAVTLAPTNLNFGPQVLGTTSRPQQVTLTNVGDAKLEITAITTPGDFAQTNNCGATVQPGVSCILSVTFAPTARGFHVGEVTISDNAPGSPQKVFVGGDGYVKAGQAFTFNNLAQGLDGNLYGTASQGGTSSLGMVFKVTPTGALTPTPIYNSDSTHGSTPYAGLVLGTDGNFYGTAYAGGSNGFGTVFRITPGGVLTTLHSFQGSDGGFPVAALVQGTDGKFYGAASDGGTYGLGTIFRIGSRGLFTTLNNFQYLPRPLAALVEGTDGNFYGSTTNGGTGAGVVFQISTDGLLRSLHEFDRTDGANPEAALVLGSDGKFYGTTVAGGDGGNGTVFGIGPLGGRFATLHSFASTDGSRPGAGLIQATDGNLYGTTWQGGASGCGTLFRITPAGTLTTLYNFNCTTDGALPYGRPVQHTNGKLYATNGAGQIFSLDVGLGPFVKTLPTSAVLGAPVIILGTNLAGATSVSFNGVAASFTVVSSSEITTTVPAGATTGQAQVVTSGRTLVSDVNFGVAPSMSGFSPASGPPGTSVVITGQSFTGVTRVAFGLFKATSFTVDSSTQITATVPSRAKTGKITVTTPGGTATSSGTFMVTGVPKEFVMPVTGQLFLQQMGGSAGAVTTFGVGTSPANFVPYYTGLPSDPHPTGEVSVGSFAAGTTIHFGMFTQLGSETGWAFSNGTDQASIVAFTDVDDSLGMGGSIIQQTSANTWLLHLDDALSYLFDDDDNDVLVQLRVAAASSK